MRRIAPMIIVLLLAIGAAAQKERLSEAVDLTDGKPCGAPEFVKTETLVGRVVKRNFAEDQTTLSGVVLQDKKDQSYFVNLDAPYLADKFSGGIVDDLSDLLSIGKFVRVKADVCGKLYLAVRVKQVRQ